MRGTRQRFARDGIAGRVERLVSDQQRADERCCCVRRSRVVLTPRRWRQVRGCCVGPTGLRQNVNPLSDGGKRARSPGRARRKPLKPLRAGTPGDSGVLVYSCAFYQCKAHTRLRGPRASGVPTAVEGAEIYQGLGRMARRGSEIASGLAVIASAAKQSILSLRGKM